jgi:spore protease
MISTTQEFVESQEMQDGVTLESFETELCKGSWVQIQNENGADAMGREIGNYVTIETDILYLGKTGGLDEIAKTVSEYLVKLMGIPNNASVLVVGIGNRNVIADSLGVRAADRVMATRHVANQVENGRSEPIREVSVISPGVMGETGISTAEIIKSICGAIEPSLVILIDALAARKTSRLCSTIQLSDAGIIPSAGLTGKANKQEINSAYLGIPTVSMGIPTVVNAATIMADFVSLMSQEHREDEDLDESMMEKITQYADALFSTSSPFVATKEIDAAIHYSSYVLSTAINMALFQEDWVSMPYYS